MYVIYALMNIFVCVKQGFPKKKMKKERKQNCLFKSCAFSAFNINALYISVRYADEMHQTISKYVL